MESTKRDYAFNIVRWNIDWELSRKLGIASQVDLALRNLLGTPHLRQFMQGIEWEQGFNIQQGQIRISDSQPLLSVPIQNVNSLPDTYSTDSYNNRSITPQPACSPKVEIAINGLEYRSCCYRALFPMLQLTLLSHYSMINWQFLLSIALHGSLVSELFPGELEYAEYLYEKIKVYKDTGNNAWTRHWGDCNLTDPVIFNFYSGQKFDHVGKCYHHNGQPVFMWLALYIHRCYDMPLQVFEKPSTILPWEKQTVNSKSPEVFLTSELGIVFHNHCCAWIPPKEANIIQLETFRNRKCFWLLDNNKDKSRKRENYAAALETLIRFREYGWQLSFLAEKDVINMNQNIYAFSPLSEHCFIKEATILGLTIPERLKTDYYGKIELEDMKNLLPKIDPIAFPGEITVIHEWSDVPHAEMLGKIIQCALAGVSFANFFHCNTPLKIWLLILPGKARSLMRSMGLSAHHNLKINELKSSVISDFSRLKKEIFPDLIVWIADEPNRQFAEILAKTIQETAVIISAPIGEKDVCSESYADHIFELYRVSSGNEYVLYERGKSKQTICAEGDGSWSNHATTPEEDQGGRNSRHATPIMFTGKENELH